jgi:hypothetical protein
MGLFKRRKIARKQTSRDVPCSYCASTNTVLSAYHGSDHPDYIRVWRGSRFVTFKCRDCGKEFYVDESQVECLDDDAVIYDEEALKEAEEELKREVEEQDDHTLW